ncbi:MAG: 6-phosphogluconolactonase [candidate division Zixibacteria bacterium]|nr:6-phosphogluconolactonase [candidate division Zixibacteria bacterium]
MNNVEISIFPDKQSVGTAVALFIIERLKTHDTKRRFSIALSGGSTPIAMYQALQNISDVAELIRSKAEFYFSDERAVGGNDSNSNYKTAKDYLFKPLGIPEGIIHRVKGDAADLDLEAKRYAALIRENHAIAPDSVPSVDLTLLGMGDDGHTASLFPDYDFESPENEIIVAPWVTSKNSQRVSFSLPLINASKCVLLLVTGKDKANIVKAVFDEKDDARRFPVSRVNARRVVWMLDSAAASLLNQSQRGSTEC